MKYLLIIILTAYSLAASAQCKTTLKSPYSVVYNSTSDLYAIQGGICVNPIQTKYVNQKAGEALYLGWAHRKELGYPGGEDSTIELSTLAEGFYTEDGFYSFSELTFTDSCLAKTALLSYLKKPKSNLPTKKAKGYGCYRCDPRDIDSYNKKHTYKKP